MAAISLTFDTVTKQGAVMIDGAAVADLSEFHMYDMGGQRYAMEIYSRMEDKAAGIYKSVRVCANKDGELVRAEEEKTQAVQLSPELTKLIADSIKK